MKPGWHTNAETGKSFFVTATGRVVMEEALKQFAYAVVFGKESVAKELAQKYGIEAEDAEVILSALGNHDG